MFRLHKIKKVKQMSGRKQHHFWQLLQRGFGIERKHNYTTVFVYKKNKTPFQTDTRNVGAERDFFDLSPGSGADDLITKTEIELQGLVKYLQNGGLLTADFNAQIAGLVTHLETRTKFVRQHFSENVSDMMDGLNGWFSKPEIFQKMMRKYATENPDEIDRFIARFSDDPSTRAALKEFIIGSFGSLGSKIVKSASDDALHFMKTLAEDLCKIVKQSHIEAILNKTPDSNRQNRYLSLNYRFRSGFDGNLICPDTMVAFLADSRSKPFLDKDDRLEAVWVPLTPDLMLIGEPGASNDLANQSVLRILASTSYEAFIAKSDVPDLRRLSSRIGKNAKILSSSDIKSIKRDTLASLI